MPIDITQVNLNYIDQAWLRAIAFSSYNQRLHHAIRTRYMQLRNWNVQQLNAFIHNGGIPQNLFLQQNPPQNIPPLPPPPHPAPDPTNRDELEANLLADFEAIRDLSLHDQLHVAVRLHQNAPEMYIKIPQVDHNPQNFEYQQALLMILLEFAVRDALFPILLYSSLIVDRDRIKPIHALRRKLMFYHATVSAVDRVNGVMQPNRMVWESLARCGINPNFHLANIDAPHASRGIFWDQHQDLTRPLAIHLLQLAQYFGANPHREMSRDRATYEARLLPANFHRLFRDYAIRQYQWMDGGNQYLNRHLRQNVVKPGSLHGTEGFIVNGSHYNKHAIGAEHWQQRRYHYNNNPNLNNAQRLHQRANDYHAMASTHIRNNLRHQNTPRSDRDWSYATTNIFHVFQWHLTALAHWRLHYPGAGEEFSRSFLLQMLLYSDLIDVCAENVSDAHYNLLRWCFPCPVAASFHVQNGPATHPFLGAIFTVHEESYRPINQPRWAQFRIIH